MKKNNKGFTLIEILVYISLVSIFLTGAVFFNLDILHSREKTQSQQNVSENARFALERISFEIRNADDIISISPTTITLANTLSGNTTISLQNEAVHLISGTTDDDLTNNQVKITNLEFLNLSNGNSKNIQTLLTIKNKEIEENYQTSVELR